MKRINMSISDNEDLDQKPSAKKTTEDSPSSSSTNNNSRRAQKRGLNNNNWSGSDDNDEKAGIQGRNIVHKNLRLSYEDQVDVSYRRTALLLRGGVGSGSVDEKKNEIIIMPSLVSLSDDFFNNSITPSNIENDVDVMDSGDVMGESPEVVSSENNFDSSSNNSRNVAGVPRLRPRSLRDSQRREQAGRALVSMFAENNNDSLNNESSGSSSVGRPREDWPIGPQGAQVPSYLLYPRQEEDVMGNTGQSSNNSNNRNGGNEEGVATRSGGEQQSTLGGQMSSSSTSTNSLLMMDTDTTANTPNTPPRVAAAAAAAAAQLPGRSNQDSPQRSAARRVREIMTRQQQHQSPSSLQHQQQAPSNQYINTAQSLEFAINRLEERLRQIDNNEKEHHNSNQNENMVEAHMLTELAEIMLHPPTDVINGTYCWKGDDDDESDNKNEGDDNEEEVTLSSTLLSATTTDDTNIVDLSSSNEPMVGGGNNYDASNKRDGDDENKDVMVMQEEEDDDGDDVSPRLPAIATTLINQETPRHYSTLQSAKQSITSIGKSCPTRRVCQHPFRRNDIVWVCRTCQSDETCVLCHDCFSNSDHTGHDVAFYHAQAGGCCDCGDADAWDPKG